MLFEVVTKDTYLYNQRSRLLNMEKGECQVCHELIGGNSEKNVRANFLLHLKRSLKHKLRLEVIKNKTKLIKLTPQ